MITAYLLAAAFAMSLVDGLTFACSSSVSEVLAQHTPKVSPRLKELAAKLGMITVSVSFNLTPEGVLLDREAAKDRLLAEMKGTAFKVVGRLKESAVILLSVGPEALEVLNRSALVSRVNENKPRSLLSHHYLFYEGGYQ